MARTRKTLPATASQQLPTDPCEETVRRSPFDDPNTVVYIPFGVGDCALVCNDLHVPHHDKDALAIMLAVARDVKPSHGFLNGDLLDFAALSRFPHHPKTPDPDEEFAAARPVIKMLDAVLPERRKYFLAGNHTDRYRRWLWEKGAALGLSLVRGIEEEECLDLRGWMTTGYHQEIDLGNFRVHHGSFVRKGTGSSAKAEFESRLISGISGHTHRAGIYRKSAGGRDYQWAENGCLCRKDMPYVGAKGADWAHAFAFLRHDGAQVQIEQVLIAEYRAYYGGRLYTPDS